MSWVGVNGSGSFLYTSNDNELVNYGELAGDVTGGIFGTFVAGIAGYALPTGAPTNGQIIKFNGTEWTYTPDASGAGLTPHALLGPDHSDTATASPVRGSLIVGNAAPEWDALALGTAEFVLYSDGTDALYTRLGQNTPFENGTALLPAVTFTGDTTTGAFLNASGVLGLSAAGDELITLDGTSTQVTIDAGQVVQTRAGGTTTLTDADYVYMVTAGSTTVTLPASPTEGQQFVIKDRDGNASGGSPITIAGNGNDIDGNASIVLKRRYGSFTLVYSDTEWNII
jgi:trimeric autotransporter adhesin